MKGTATRPPGNPSSRSEIIISTKTVVSVQGTLYSLVSLTTFLLLVVVVFLPMMALGAGFLASEEKSEVWKSVLRETRQWRLLGASVVIASLSTVIATLLGVLFGFAVAYLRVPSGRFLRWAVLAPFLIPPYVAATAWIDILGSNGLVARLAAGGAPTEPASSSIFTLAGVSGVMALSYFPIVAVACAAALGRFDVRLEEAAGMITGRVRVVRSVVLPLIAPDILAASLVVFILTLTEFSVPSLLLVNTYPVEIQASCALHEIQTAVAQSLPLVLLGLAAYWVWLRWLGPRQAWLSGRARRPAPDRRAPRPAGLAAACACWIVLAVAAVAPMVALLIRALPLRSFAEAWDTAGGEFLRSVALAGISATGLTVLALAMALLSRGRVRFSGVAIVPFLMSGPLFGLGMIALWNRPGIMGHVYDSPAILVLANIARYVFFAYLGVCAALAELDPHLDEAAQVVGVPWYRRFWGILTPLIATTLVVVWGLAFVFSLRELETAVLVAPPGPPPIAVRLFSLMHYGPSRLVAALSLIMTGAILGAAVATGGTMALLRRYLHGIR